jgi:hypothetical protein
VALPISVCWHTLRPSVHDCGHRHRAEGAGPDIARPWGDYPDQCRLIAATDRRACQRAEQGKRCTWRRSGRRRAQCMSLQRRAYLHCNPTQTHGHRVPWVCLSEGDVCRRTTGRPCRWLPQQQLTLHGSSAMIRTVDAHESITSQGNLLQCRCGEGQRRKFWRN